MCDERGHGKTGRKNCAKCGAWKPLIEFGSQSVKVNGAEASRSRRINPRCLYCERHRAKANRRQPIGHNELDIGPFQDWLHDRMTTRNYTINEFANRIGVQDRQLRTWLEGEFSAVHIDTVDKALINELGSPALLNEMYPVED